MKVLRLAASILAATLLAPDRALAAGVAIDSISPSCASVGDLVTITGRGFGAQNVRVVVDGVAADVVSSTGNTATFVVPMGVHLGPTTVRATNPGGQTDARAFRVCDLLMPGAWAGKWQLAVTYRNRATQDPTGKDVTTAFIRPLEPFGVLRAAKRVNCTGTISGELFDVHCSGQVTNGSCTVTADVQVTASRALDTLSGAGTRLIVQDGICGPFPSNDDAIQFSGIRLSTKVGASPSASTFLQSFFPQAALLGLLP